MIASLPLAVALSVVFVLTGAYALVPWWRMMTAPSPRPARIAGLTHPAMSVAMLVTIWTKAGTTGVTAQIGLFTVVAGYFALDAVRRYRNGPYGRADRTAHAVMAAAVVWMLAATPLTMPASASAPWHGDHAGRDGDAAMDMGTRAGTSGWVLVVTVAVCAALLITSAFSAARTLRGRTAPVGASRSGRADVRRADPDQDGSGHTSTTAAVLASTAVGTAEPAFAAHPLLGARIGAGSHALTGLAMATMLLAKVAGS